MKPGTIVVYKGILYIKRLENYHENGSLGMDALAKHVEKDDSPKWGLIDSMGRRQKTIIINESGLYSLILSSKLDRAREFKHWVTSEVLPQIRMTGGYIPTKDADGRQLTDAEIVDRAHDIIGRTLEMVNNQNADCLTATQVARLWGMEVHSFNNLLAGMGIQHRKGGRWQLAPELLNCGLAEERLYCSYSLKGKYRTQRYLVWTPEAVPVAAVNTGVILSGLGDPHLTPEWHK